MTFSVTYDIVTFESAENGDVAESGFIVESVSLRDAIGEISGAVDCGRGWYEQDARIDYGTGEHETRALHADGPISAGTRARISRLLRRY